MKWGYDLVDLHLHKKIYVRITYLSRNKKLVCIVDSGVMTGR